MSEDYDKQGFTPLDRHEIFSSEGRKAINGDKGRINTERKADKTSIKYTVTEEKRRMPGEDNSSIQSVGYSAIVQRDRWGTPYISGGVASLSTDDCGKMGLLNDKSISGTTLLGHNSGRVEIVETDKDGKVIIKDITEAAAKSGITAAGVRRTQKDVAADGEVDRREQQTIKRLIAAAKGLAK